MPTKIQWCDEVWNPVTGCTKIREGCNNCYAERIAKRFWGDRKFTNVVTHSERLSKPFHWRRPRKIFVCSMSDLFHEEVPELFIYSVFDVIAALPEHTFIILTKRPERMNDFVSRVSYIRQDELEHLKRPACSLSPYKREFPTKTIPNLWPGVSISKQKDADEMIPILLDILASKRIVSVEPQLESINVAPYFWTDEDAYNRGIEWVIFGAESGPHHRSCKIDWIRDGIRQCKDFNIPVFVKQIHLNGKLSKNMDEWPEDLRVREFPE